jgi:ABC-2 type transport system ATP-binding protein
VSTPTGTESALAGTPEAQPGVAISATGLVRRFGNYEAVKDVSFQVQEGEVFGFLGPNGAGKTTTIRMLCTLLRLTAGRAQVAGFDVVAQPMQVRRSIGIIFQDPSLDDRLTAEENLNFHGMIYHLPRAVRRARAGEVLKMVDLSDRRRDLVRTFSGGMKRRLEIARGLMHLPRVLFLDEPTIGLDPQTRSHIWEYLLRLRQERSLTIFLTTHYMEEAEHCDRIAVIDHGRIVALDTPEGLKAQVGGDIITLRTDDDAAVAREIGERYQVTVRHDAGGLQVEVANGATFIPALLQGLPGRVQAVNLRRPTLDDVFLKLTGREIREEEASARDVLRAAARRRGRIR